MNPRRVHALMSANFPPVELVTLDWVNVLETDGTMRNAVLDALISEFIHADSILVEVSRKVGDLIPREQVIPYLQQHVGKGQIRMSDRHFHGHLLIMVNGVAAGWSSQSLPLQEADSCEVPFGPVADVD